MSTTQARIEQLIQLQMKQGLSVQEQQELLNYMQDPLLASYIHDLLDQTFRQEPGLESLSSDQEAQILKNILGEESVKIRPLFRWLRITAAAMLLATLGLGVYWYTSGPKETVFLAHEIKPGKVGATLTLADGKTIHLGDMSSDTVINHGQVKIYKDELGELVYEVLSESDEKTSGFNTLRTAFGETYTIKLQDGTKIWLNAGSSLTYPLHMKGPERRVTLDGEAYFEVAKLKVKDGERLTSSRFVVASRTQDIEVLGTSFNVSAYATDANTATTLVEGSVKIKGEGQTKLLQPGQQSIMSSSGIAIKNVNTDLYTSWKAGAFSFADEYLENILKQAARWYDVKIVYDNEALRRFRFEGLVSRSSDIRTLLQALESTGDVQFKVQGKTVYVFKN